MDSKDRQIEELKALVAALTKRVAELELELAKARKDSSTSSKPPSSDIAKAKPKKSSRRKPRKGGQPGHQRQLRQPLPPDRVNDIVEYEIDDDEVSRLGLTLTGNFDILQRIELPETPVHVTEHRLAVYEDSRRPSFHPRLSRIERSQFLGHGCWRRSAG